MTFPLVEVLLLMILALALISFSSSNVSAGSLSDEEIERQLKILNKPPLKTFQTSDGSIVDCVDFNKQPALDNPLLKNHKIQTIPSSCPPVLVSELACSGNNGTNATYTTGKLCPTGTVPIC